MKLATYRRVVQDGAGGGSTVVRHATGKEGDDSKSRRERNEVFLSGVMWPDKRRRRWSKWVEAFRASWVFDNLQSFDVNVCEKRRV